MAELFRDPSCSQWWLPRDEGLTPILRKIRAFADARNGGLVTQQTEAVREINAIFSNLRLDSDDSPSPRQPRSTGGAVSGKGKNIRGKR